jgi:hypothetical protein
MLDSKADALRTEAENTLAENYVQTGDWVAIGGDTVYEQNKRAIEDGLGPPLACVVSPLGDLEVPAEALRARQDELARFLSAWLASPRQKPAGDWFEQYIKLRRLDVAARSSLPIVNSYGLGGNRFGITVGSPVSVLANAGAPKTAPALEKLNLPILVVLGFSPEDLQPRIVWVNDHAEIWEPRLRLTQGQRWVRQSHHQAGANSAAFSRLAGQHSESRAELDELISKAERMKEEVEVAIAKPASPLSGDLAKRWMRANERYDWVQRLRTSVTDLAIPAHSRGQAAAETPSDRAEGSPPR